MENEATKGVLESESDELLTVVTLSEDALKLFLSITPKVEKPSLTLEALVQLLQPLKPERFDRAVLEDIVKTTNNGEKTELRRLAKGSPPIPGRDGRIIFLVRALSYETGVLTFDNIQPQQFVARIYPPAPGTDGITALDEPIPYTPGKPIKVDFDKKALLRVPAPAEGPSYDTLQAIEGGYLTSEGGQHTIKTHLILESDVGPKTGHVTFIGAVTVKNDISKDYRLVAGKDVQIGGNLSGGSITSANGSITIAGNAVGERLSQMTAPDNASAAMIAAKVVDRTGTVVKAFDSLTASILQGVEAEAGGNIVIEKEAGHSIIHTKSSLLMPEGHLYGGTVFAVCGVDAKIIGTASEAPTRIVLCSDIESTLDYSTLLEKERIHEEGEKMLLLHLGPYSENPNRVNILRPEYRQRIEQLLKKLEEIRQSKAEILRQKEIIRNSELHNPILRVNFRQRIHRGTTITVGEHRFEVERTLYGPSTIEFDGLTQSFVISEFKPLECARREHVRG